MKKQTMTVEKTSHEHNFVLNRGVEYNEYGNVCGEWAETICSECGFVDGFGECN